MQLTKIEKNGIACAVVNSNEIVITDAQSALDVLCLLYTSPSPRDCS